MQANPWRFERSVEAAEHNAEILMTHKYDMEKATQEPTNTILSYGAEFKPWDSLQDLFQFHRYHDN